MQNKGIVRIFAVALILVSLFYLSFTVVTTTYNNKAKEYAAGDKMKDIWISGRTFECQYNGEWVTFKAY